MYHVYAVSGCLSDRPQEYQTKRTVKLDNVIHRWLTDLWIVAEAGEQSERPHRYGYVENEGFGFIIKKIVNNSPRKHKRFWLLISKL